MISVAIGRTANGHLYKVDLFDFNSFPDGGKVDEVVLSKSSENVIEQCGFGFRTSVIWSSTQNCEELQKKLQDAFDCH